MCAVWYDTSPGHYKSSVKLENSNTPCMVEFFEEVDEVAEFCIKLVEV